MCDRGFFEIIKNGFTAFEALEYSGLPRQRDYWEKLKNGLPSIEKAWEYLFEAGMGRAIDTGMPFAWTNGRRDRYKILKNLRKNIYRDKLPMAFYEAIKYSLVTYRDRMIWSPSISTKRYKKEV